MGATVFTNKATKRGATVFTNKATTASVLSFSEDADQLCAWEQELSCAGVRVVTPTCAADARDLLATQGFTLAVLDASVRTHSDGPASSWTFFSGVRPKIIWVTRDFSSFTVLTLSEDGDLVLPHPLVDGTLLRAVEMRSRSTDEVSSFASLYRLSLRETAVLRHALAGLNNDEVADALGCSPRTVSSFWNRIFRKTNVSGQRDVIIRFLQSSRGPSKSGTFLGLVPQEQRHR
jgi:DNA-binding CsgD family transcriptional regulator